MEEMTNEMIKKKIMSGFRKSIRKLIAEKKLRNQKMVIYLNGKIKWVKASDL